MSTRQLSVAPVNSSKSRPANSSVACSSTSGSVSMVVMGRPYEPDAVQIMGRGPQISVSAGVAADHEVVGAHEAVLHGEQRGHRPVRHTGLGVDALDVVAG